ncbi:hypothetical protein AMECASPLE_030755 [Ameca splendens]|uniref:Uncharacterized protein n=1 Tax=Ameca splendens TaxID=208324 RepID=A0ABV0Z404_9TELE
MSWTYILLRSAVVLDQNANRCLGSACYKTDLLIQARKAVLTKSREITLVSQSKKHKELEEGRDIHGLHEVTKHEEPAKSVANKPVNKQRELEYGPMREEGR